MRDCLGDISSEVWPSVIKKPIVREADPSSNDVGLTDYTQKTQICVYTQPGRDSMTLPVVIVCIETA